MVDKKALRRQANAPADAANSPASNRKQSLRLQKARGAEENLPQRGHGLAQRRRPAPMRRRRHDGLLGRRKMLGANALHGPLERRDRRLRPIEQERRQEHVFRRFGDGRRRDKENRRAQSDFAHRSRHRLRFKGLQRAPSPNIISRIRCPALERRRTKGRWRP